MKVGIGQIVDFRSQAQDTVTATIVMMRRAAMNPKKSPGNYPSSCQQTKKNNSSSRVFTMTRNHDTGTSKIRGTKPRQQEYPHTNKAKTKTKQMKQKGLWIFPALKRCFPASGTFSASKRCFFSTRGFLNIHGVLSAPAVFFQHPKKSVFAASERCFLRTKCFLRTRRCFFSTN